MGRIVGLLCLVCLVHHCTRSQELEPRAYGALPKNLNSIVIAYGLSKGNVLTDPALPVANFTVTAHNLTAAYVRTFGLAGKLARIQVSIPFIYMIGKIQVNGNDISGSRNGVGDARLRFGINLTGTPVLTKEEFNHFTQKTIFGVSLVTILPTGLYHAEKQVNTGSNRWAFKPEMGISKRFKRVYTEAYAGIWFYTINKKYLNDKMLAQQPVFSIQAHGSYFFKNRMWASINTTWFNGGRTAIDNISRDDLMDNWRVGGTWTFSIARGHLLKLQFHIGAFTTSDYEYNVVSLAYQHVF